MSLLQMGWVSLGYEIPNHVINKFVYACVSMYLTLCASKQPFHLLWMMKSQYHYKHEFSHYNTVLNCKITIINLKFGHPLGSYKTKSQQLKIKHLQALYTVKKALCSHTPLLGWCMHTLVSKGVSQAPFRVCNMNTPKGC